MNQKYWIHLLNTCRVMIESMACGTPVIGNKNVGDIYCGSVAEIIDNGLTGYTIDAKDKESAIIQSLQAINSLDLLDRKIVRNVFESVLGRNNFICGERNKPKLEISFF